VACFKAIEEIMTMMICSLSLRHRISSGYGCRIRPAGVQVNENKLNNWLRKR
jgi:hypothetical protein